MTWALVAGLGGVVGGALLSKGGGGGTNYPQQQGYGEALSESLRAQIDLLRGTGEFEDTGGLQELLTKYEAPMRKETAQLDTDVMRQTLLGDYRQPGMAGATGTAGVAGAAGAAPPAGQFIRDGNVIKDTETGQAVPQKDWMVEKGYMERWKAPDGKPGTSLGHEQWKLTDAGREAGYAPYFAKHKGLTQISGEDVYVIYAKGDQLKPGVQAKSLLPEGANEKEYFFDRGVYADGAAKPLSEFTGKIFEEVRGPTPAPTPTPTPGDGEVGPAVREGTGMLDLFGPKEAGMVTKQIGSEKDVYEQYMRNNPDAVEYFELAKARDPSIHPDASAIADKGLAAFGRFHHAEAASVEDTPRPLPEIGEIIQVSRRAGFEIDPLTGEEKFLGLTTLGADVSEQLARKQRAADIYDVEKLGPQATEAYRQQGVQYDAAGNAIAGTGIAGTLAEARRLGPGGAAGYSAMATDPLFSGAATPEGGLRKVAQELGATTPDITGGRIGDFDPFQAALQPPDGIIPGPPPLPGPQQGAAQGPAPEPDINLRDWVADPGQYDWGAERPIGQPVARAPTGTELLRGTMLGQVQEGLGEGLTERELRTLREGARSRATAMGRTYDPKATIDELKIQLMEDEGRRAQRLQQAQSVLGGEVGIQQADLGRDVQAQLANLQTQQAGIGRELGAAESDVERAMRQQAMTEQYRQAGLGQERAAAASMVGLEQATGADPFQAILGRPSGAGAAMGQQMFGSAGYGLQSQPQYLNPEAGLSYISQQAANQASMWGAGQAADAARYAGTMDMIGGLGGAAIGLFDPFKKKVPPVCWVAREVYGIHNPAWLDFREWMLLRAPSWFRALYIGYGERFAKFISDKPRLKARIRGWMDTKIGRV